MTSTSDIVDITDIIDGELISDPVQEPIITVRKESKSNPVAICCCAFVLYTGSIASIITLAYYVYIVPNLCGH